MLKIKECHLQQTPHIEYHQLGNTDNTLDTSFRLRQLHLCKRIRASNQDCNSSSSNHRRISGAHSTQLQEAEFYSTHFQYSHYRISGESYTWLHTRNPLALVGARAEPSVLKEALDQSACIDRRCS